MIEKMEEARLALERAADREYKAVLGQTLLAWRISGYVDNHSVELALDEPVEVRVVETSRDCILRWDGPWLDPIYEAQLGNVKEDSPAHGLRSIWVYGTGRSLEGSVCKSDFSREALTLPREHQRPSLFSVKLVAKGVNVTANGEAQARRYAIDDGREFRGQWNYHAMDVHAVECWEAAGAGDGQVKKEASKSLDDLEFTIRSGGQVKGSLYEFDIQCEVLVMAADEVGAVVEIVELLGKPLSADELGDSEGKPEEADRVWQRRFRNPNREVRKTISESVKPDHAPGAAHSAAALAEQLQGAHVLYADEKEAGKFLEVTGRELREVEACYLTLQSGRRFLAEGPFEVLGGVWLKVMTPLEQEAQMLLKPGDVSAIECTV